MNLNLIWTSICKSYLKWRHKIQLKHTTLQYMK